MTHVLVTGAAGYVGSLLAPALLAQGHHVTAVDNLRYEQHSLNACFADANFSFVRADVRDSNIMRPLYGRADVIIPLACLVGAPVCDRFPSEAEETNEQVITRMMAGLRAEQRILFPTTNSGYGSSKEPCNESAPLKPLSLYASTKVAAEEAVLEHGNAVTLRLATAFGASPRQRFDLLVNDFVYRACRDRSLVLYEPHFRRNFIHVRDIVNAFLHALAHPEMQGPFNVGLSDANLTKLELCQLIKRHIPQFDWALGVGTDQDQRDYVVDNSRIESAGFACRYSLDDGIVELKKLSEALSNERYGNV